MVTSTSVSLWLTVLAIADTCLIILDNPDAHPNDLAECGVRCPPHGPHPRILWCHHQALHSMECHDTKLVGNHSKGKPVLIEAKDKIGRVAPRKAIAKLLCQRGFDDINFDIDDVCEME